ncbi:hypothetical protein KA107_00460 [Candidatus Pacearchaeota archaeon]|nr:hypothetical protein [Candidatus Pacearchaeota archaeon]
MLENFTQIQEGIYQVTPKLENPVLPVLIAVHPYFGEPKQEQMRPRKVGEDYCQARDRIFREWAGKGNVAFFESFNDYWLKNFQERVLPIFSKGLYLVQQPFSIDEEFQEYFNSVASFLKTLGSEKFLFIGGGFGTYFDPRTWEKRMAGACLSGAISRLARGGVKGKIIAEACFPKQASEKEQKNYLPGCNFYHGQTPPWEKSKDLK